MARSETRTGGLEVNDDRAWQEKFWTAQRVGWIVMALFILAALSGLTGMGGPLASARAELGGGTIDYPRITRWQADDQMQVRIVPSSLGEVELTLSREFIQLFTISSIQPEPSEVRATAAGHRFTFESEPGGGVRVISLTVKASRPVLAQRFRVSLGDAEAKQMTVTVLP